ncbi:MAG: CoA transferase, partial [Gammaproteobacteria bacterium]|nr:CoA transferase [Gammaproteobacteria bacterium]NIT62918.1 CoA transferase [Gammaproteobacteria bacterium]NIV19878.1 CoA transferase [Gammaproteobacteria bacterium]NIY31498.1 CoA transferase [Gammaproteobacteria bacterium]
PGVMARLGLAYDDVCALRPDVVYASMSAFGQDSPWRDKPGFELIAQALAGMVSVSSEPGRPPAKIQPQVTDLSSGMLLCIGILGALQHRARTGEGQWVQASLFESAVALMTNLVSMGLFGAPVPLGQRSRNPQLFPSQAFRTADGHVAVVCTPDHWPRFCRALGRAEWIAHPDYARLAYRVEHYDAMEAAVEEILRRQPTAHWVAALEREQ